MLKEEPENKNNKPLLRKTRGDIREWLGRSIDGKPGRGLGEMRVCRKRTGKETKRRLNDRTMLRARQKTEREPSRGPDKTVHTVPRRIHNGNLVGHKLDGEKQEGQPENKR